MRGGLTRIIIYVAQRVPLVDVLKSNIVALLSKWNLQVILSEGLKRHMARLVVHVDAHASNICLAAFILTA